MTGFQKPAAVGEAPGSLQLCRYRTARHAGHLTADAAAYADVDLEFARLTDKEERL